MSLERLLTWAAAVSVGVFLIWSAIRIRDITANMYANSDIASGPVIAELFPDRSGHVVLGYYPWLESLFAMDLTRWVPAHVSFWKAAPFIVYGASVALVGWTVMRAASWRAGLIVALAMAAPAQLVIYMLGATEQRLPAFFHTVLLAAFLVTVPVLAGWSGRQRILWGLALAVTLAVGVSSDPLLLLGAVVPFLGAVALAWRLQLLRLDLAGLAAGACVAGALGGVALKAIAAHYEIIQADNVFQMAGAGRVVSNTGLLLEDVALFAHGKFATGMGTIDAVNAAREGVAVAAIVAVAIFVIAVGRAARGVLADDTRSAEGRLLAAYWGISILAVSVAFVSTTAPVGTNSVRYVTTLWPGMLTIAVVVYGRRILPWLATLAAFTAILGCVELARGTYTPTTTSPPDPREAALVERFAAANDLDHGYAGYWDAAPIMLDTGFRVRVYPIQPCGPAADTYCPFQVHSIESWYEPKEGVRTFYLVGDQELFPPLKPPPPAWGTPFKAATVGPFTIYAYGYDIASRIKRYEPGTIPPPAPDVPGEAD
jgi:hypothetical protein